MNQSPVTLRTAIAAQVRAFAKANQMFSVFDITKAIRNSDIELTDVKMVDGTLRYNIPHAEVKTLFLGLWDAGDLDDVNLSRRFNGTFMEYTPAMVTTDDAAQVATSATPTPSAPASSAQNPAPTTSNITLFTEDRVIRYLKNCKAKGIWPTLRQVQSAIKRNDSYPIPTCGELYNYIYNSQEYDVDTHPDCLSRTRVRTD
jgi:hypothetical protein